MINPQFSGGGARFGFFLHASSPTLGAPVQALVLGGRQAQRVALALLAVGP
ncbi:hypothetical protein [Xanthomonas fragariae]|uniref:hypothetical protein n=1 Tax=Xanthomonas fragariae TaxID=48664 RepID=UPI001ABE61FB|nr:hypothetical protein [Xanthomonas fragariae]UKR52794.1 hypothetical protein K4A87_01230 [Xanthomonas fragariae]